MIDFRTSPARYRHWKLKFDGRVAWLMLDVDEQGGLFPGYELKLNSYDLGVDIELHDAVNRIRFEHPEIGAVIITSARERTFCAGANIRMLAASAHSFKVNFCKFTNETRNGIEQSAQDSGLHFITMINGACAGGGYELALATEHLILTDDGSSAVSLPEVPLLAVLPGTGGLTRLVDKRRVRRDRADFFCTTEEGVRGARALEWGLVDELAPPSKLSAAASAKAAELARTSDRPADARGIALSPLARKIEGDEIEYRNVSIKIDRALGAANITIVGPRSAPPESADQIEENFWPLGLARELDDAILHLRLSEEQIGTWIFRASGDGAIVGAYDRFLNRHREHWLAREVTNYLKRVLKRLDVSARSIFALIEAGSCFVGTLFEIALAADRAYMLEGARENDEAPPASIVLTEMNFGAMRMGNGLSRLETRFLGNDSMVEKLRKSIDEKLDARAAAELGLVGFAPDDIDWDDEVRVAIESRASFSPDALTAMEASLRFAGPETIETKIFARLSAWQNWIFQRPNAVGDAGALKRYGSGQRVAFDRRRV